MKKLNQHQLGWVCGVIEGEGCISCSSARNSKHLYWSVAVGMSDEDVVERLLSWTGIGTTCKMRKLRDRKQIWRWKVAKQEDVRDLLTAILPSMGMRRSEKIKEALAALEGFVRGKRLLDHYASLNALPESSQGA